MKLITKEAPQDNFNLAFALYERTAERATKMAGMVGMLKAELASLVKYEEVTFEGKHRAQAALRDFEKLWDDLMADKTDADHDTE